MPERMRMSRREIKISEQKIRISVISFTEKGSFLAGQIKNVLEEPFRQQNTMQKQETDLAEESIQGKLPSVAVTVQESRTLTQPLHEWCRQAFEQSQVLIFVGAAGIAVRQIAPFVKDKFQDPAVLVVDELGNYVIPVLSGHVGGGNQWALQLARGLGAVPVITTATDLHGKFAVDVFAAKNSLTISDRVLAKKISASVLRGETIGFFCEGKVSGRMPHELVRLEEVSKKVEKHTAERQESELGKAGNGQICVGIHRPKTSGGTLFLHPKALVLGIGCKKGKSVEEIEAFVQKMFAQWQLAWDSVGAVASVELKRQEKGLQEFCRRHQLPFWTYSPEQLAEVPGNFAESDFVKHTVGVGNVCERAAVLGTVELANRRQSGIRQHLLSEAMHKSEEGQDSIKEQSEEGFRLIRHKTAENGITLAVAEIDWSVEFE